MIDAPVRDVFAVVTELLASAPTDDELLAYKFPDDLQARLGYLLERNREAELTCEERHEFDDYIRANRMITSLKIKTKLGRKGLT